MQKPQKGAPCDHGSFYSGVNMAGTITSLRFQKRTPDRVNVYLDGKFAFGMPAVEAARLRVGQFLSDAEIGRLQACDLEQKAYDRAVRFLSYRPRSQAEVRQHLARAGLDEGVVEAVLARLVNHGYLDDAEFARFWVENRQRFRPRGAHTLRQELQRKGLDNETIGGALTDLDPLAEAYQAARPRALRLAGVLASTPLAFRRKLHDFLLRRGFDYDVIKQVVSRLEQELRTD